MAIDPDSFDIPVSYDFSNVDTPKSLIDQMAKAGGFTATKLAYARDILLDMEKEISESDYDSSKVTNWLSFPACYALRELEDSLLKLSKGRCSTL